MKVFEEFDTEEIEESPKQNNLTNVSKLIECALSGQHNEWEFIKSFDELNVALSIKSANKRVVKGFTKSTKALYKEYNKAVKQNKTTLDLVIALQELSQVVSFYKGEIAILDDMLDEFRAYVSLGHLGEIVLGYTRPSGDLYDHRKQKPTDL